MPVAPPLNVGRRLSGDDKDRPSAAAAMQANSDSRVRKKSSVISATVMQKQGDCAYTWPGQVSHINYESLLV
jgi:hypothetical protein